MSCCRGCVAAGLVFLLGWAAWRCRVMGGGDVKLLAACALLAPPAAVPGLVLAVALAGGVLALAYLALQPLVPVPALARPGAAARTRVAGRGLAHPPPRPAALRRRHRPWDFLHAPRLKVPPMVLRILLFGLLLLGLAGFGGVAWYSLQPARPRSPTHRRRRPRRPSWSPPGRCAPAP